MAGSRPGANIASAWISMMKTGGKGFTQNAKSVQYGTNYIYYSYNENCRNFERVGLHSLWRT